MRLDKGAHSSFASANRPFARFFPSLRFLFWRIVFVAAVKWNRTRSNPAGRREEKQARGKMISRSDCHLVIKARVRERIIYCVASRSFLASSERNDRRRRRFYEIMLLLKRSTLLRSRYILIWDMILFCEDLEFIFKIVSRITGCFIPPW